MRIVGDWDHSQWKLVHPEKMGGLSVEEAEKMVPGISRAHNGAVVRSDDYNRRSLAVIDHEYHEVYSTRECGYCGCLEPAVEEYPGEWPSCPDCGGV
jgi:hypothetical protein